LKATPLRRLRHSALVAALLLVGCESDQQASAPEAPPFVFRSLELRQKRADGQRDWDLTSPEARYEFNRRLVRASRPEGVLYRNDQPSFRISADRATVVNDGELVLLEGQVQLQQLQGQKVLIKGDRLRWTPATALLVMEQRPEAIDALTQAGDRIGGSNIGLAFTGLALEEQRAGQVTWVLFALGVTVVYLLLAAHYESFIDPLIILLTVPMALLGALIGLKLRGLPLDVYGQMGLLVLVSLAAKNGILIVEFANQRVAAGLTLRDAVIDAAENRMRPILLTAVTSLAGFLPLLFAQGT